MQPTHLAQHWAKLDNLVKDFKRLLNLYENQQPKAVLQFQRFRVTLTNPNTQEQKIVHVWAEDCRGALEKEEVKPYLQKFKKQVVQNLSV